jgi:hypothetical protein
MLAQYLVEALRKHGKYGWTVAFGSVAVIVLQIVGRRAKKLGLRTTQQSVMTQGFCERSTEGQR